MGLNHDFLLVDRRIDGESAIDKFIHDPRAVHLHDDFISYIWDSLLWIPTTNPCRNESGYGLNRWGLTSIESKGAPIASAIFAAWVQLFSSGPPELTLTGLFVLDPVDFERDEALDPIEWRGSYETLKYDRDTILAVLSQLVSWCEIVAASQGQQYLYHGGI